MSTGAIEINTAYIPINKIVDFLGLAKQQIHVVPIVKLIKPATP